MTLGFPPIALPLGSLVGGTTVINSGTCFRVPDFVHAKWTSRYGFGEDLSAAAFAPYYERVEQRIGVGAVTPDIMGANNDIARRGAEVLGWSGGYLQRNARSCVGSNRCAFGCPTEAKQAMHITYLPDAVAAGGRVVSGVRVRRVTFDGRRATGVIAEVRRPDGRVRTVRVSADEVVMAAGTVHTPLLLRASGIRHPNLGKRMTIHPAVKVSGLFPGQDFFAGAGVPQSYYIDEFQEQGIMMEGAHVPPDMLSFSLPGKGRAHKALMERSREIASYGFLVSDEPSGSVHRGFAGEALLRYDISERDLGLMQLGIKKLAELFFAAGAQELYMPSSKLPVLRPGDDIEAIVDAAKLRPMDLDVAAFHPLGTCGFGPGRRRFPLDTNLAVRGRVGLHVADGSVMPSSLAVNPQLTIMALAVRLADHLHCEVL
jgi:choline dehydrogenase-like flavoprotein